MVQDETAIRFLEKRLNFWEEKLQSTKSKKTADKIMVKIENIEAALDELI